MSTIRKYCQTKFSPRDKKLMVVYLTVFNILLQRLIQNSQLS